MLAVPPGHGRGVVSTVGLADDEQLVVAEGVGLGELEGVRWGVRRG